MRILAITISLAALLGIGVATARVATAHPVHCTTTCTGNTCYTNCY